MSGELIAKTIQTGAADDPLLINNDVTISGNIDAANISSTIDIDDLVNRINQLEQDVQILKSYKQVVNFTKYVSVERQDLSGASIFKLDEFEVKKISPTSTLFVQGSISGWGNASYAMMQRWKYGESQFEGQSLCYGTHSRLYPTSAVIETDFVGSQMMELWYYTKNDQAGNHPFTYYNPNSGVEERLGQTKSVYFVWEIEM